MIYSNDEIEILDFDDPSDEVQYNNLDIVEKEEELVKKNKNKKNKSKKKNGNKKTSKATKIAQIIFCTISFLFIAGCFVFYGGRLIKYYSIYNPKPMKGERITLLANEITSKSEIVYEGDGLYISGGNYIFKGDISNNYIRFNNMLWRILKINKDDTIDIILDDYINVLPWDKDNNDFIKSDINNYLNDYFLNKVNKELLTNSTICVDKFDKLDELSCEKTSDNNFVSLLDISYFLNSIINGKSYLSKENEIFWLNNQGTEKVWHTNGINVGMSTSDSFYEIRPVVTLKTAVVLYDGDGTKDNPYIIEKANNKLSVGNYVKLDDDLWIVNEVDKNVRLSLAEKLDKQYHFSYQSTKFDLEDKDSLAQYLNTTYLNNLSYKDILIEEEWYNGSFDGSYKSILKETVKAKVGVLNLIDLKFDSSINNYLLMTSNKDGYIYTYDEVIKAGKPTIYRNVRPCISVSSSSMIKSGDGTLNNPYVLEV